MPFNMFPYSNFHELNLDWVLTVIKTMAAAIEQASTTISGYEARLAAVEGGLTSVEGTVSTIAPKANGAVRYDAQQQLTAPQQTMARGNIGAAPSLGVVMYNTPQALGDAYKAQARENIGAISADDIPAAANAVLYTEQSLTDGQKTQARTNIGAAAASAIPDVSDVVRYSSQSLTDGQKTQARTNIGAAAASAIPDVSDVVRYSSQSLTDGQKVQARTNIGAASLSSVNELASAVVYNIYIEETAADTFEITGGNLEDADTAWRHGAPVIVNLDTSNNGLLRGLASFTAESNGDLLAVVSVPAVPGPGNSTGYRVLITNNGTSDVLTCTSFEYKLMPSCTSSDRGKVLAVGSTGAPAWVDSPAVITDSSSTTPTIASAVNNTIYKFTQDLTSLSLTAGSGSYMICFHSGSTATTTSFPASILGLDDFVPEIKTYYEINIMDGRAVWMGWADPVE